MTNSNTVDKTTSRHSECEEYSRLDCELVDAMIAGDSDAIESVKEKMLEFESRSQFIDFQKEELIRQDNNTAELETVRVVDLPTFSGHSTE